MQHDRAPRRVGIGVNGDPRPGIGIGLLRGRDDQGVVDVAGLQGGEVDAHGDVGARREGRGERDVAGGAVSASVPGSVSGVTVNEPACPQVAFSSLAR